MTGTGLSSRDLSVIFKIKDPESTLQRNPLINNYLPKDPQYPNEDEYQAIADVEKRAIAQLAAVANHERDADQVGESPLQYEESLAALSELIALHPRYASARNNHAQILRRLCGDAMLVDKNDATDSLTSQPLLLAMSTNQRRQAAAQALSDLDTCISLLSPTTLSAAISSHSAKVLSSAYTQRAAIYHQTAKLLNQGATLSVDMARKEASWSKLDFEEAAARDFDMGGRYGNKIAKGLAVSTNPTAKLCGQMVQEAMRTEYSAV